MPRTRIPRYTPTQILYHLTMFLAIGVLVLSGLAISLSWGSTAGWFTWHLYATWVFLLATVVHVWHDTVSRPLFENMWITRQTVRNILTRLRGLTGATKEVPKYGKYAPGQIFFHWILTLDLLGLIITGFALWEPTRSLTAPFWLWWGWDAISYFRVLHQVFTFALIALLLGHLYFALLVPKNWIFLRSIVTGGVDRDKYAIRHELPAEASSPAGSAAIIAEAVLTDAPTGAVPRRRFLKGSVAVVFVAIGSAILGKISGLANLLGPRPAMAAPNALLAFDPALCTGCQTCMVVCSTYNSGRVSLELARLVVPRHPFNSTFAEQVNYEPRPCLQCADAPCANACPVAAIQVDRASGTNARVIDERACIGCQKCIDVCAQLYGVGRVRFDPDRQKALKCHECYGSPRCVSWCPNAALRFTKASALAPGSRQIGTTRQMIEQDYRLVLNSDRVRELGYPQT